MKTIKFFKILIFVISTFFLKSLYAQNYSTFYALDNNKILHEVDVSSNGCSSSIVNYDYSCMTGNPLSIALDGNILYTVDNKGRLYKTVLGSNSSCTYLTTFTFNSASNTTIYGLTVDKNGILYAGSGGEMSTYNPITNTLTHIPGVLPNGFTVGGDFIFYLGNIYMPTHNSPSVIVKINLTNLANSTVFMNMTNTYQNVYGISSVAQHCDNSQVYALSTPTALGTYIIPINMTTGTQAPALCNLSFQTYDAASISEGDAYVKPMMVINNPSTCSPSTVNLTGANITLGSTSDLVSFTYWSDSTISHLYPTPTSATSGTYYIVGSTSDGCQDTLPVKVTINLPTTSTTNLSICPSALPYSWNGSSYLSAGTYSKTLVNSVGCDSIATLVLSVKATTFSTTTVSICPSGFPYSWNGSSYLSAGTYSKTLVNSLGCDSIATLVLSVKATTSSTTTVNICPSGLPYSWNGSSYLSAGTYTKTLVNAVGCDSIATLVLHLQAKSLSTTNISVCFSELPYSWNGSSYLSAGTYTKTLVNAVGCDSICKLVLNIIIDCEDILFPSAFSPNNDGLNDNFGAIGNLSQIKEFKLQIFNRWGQLVFSTNNPYERWDGKLKGSEKDTGDFVWVSSYLYINSRKQKKGNVVLVK